VQSDGTNITTREYYAFAGITIAMKECTGGTCSGLAYFLTDHQGAVVMEVGGKNC
jgi:hypothetical protein